MPTWIPRILSKALQSSRIANTPLIHRKFHKICTIYQSNNCQITKNCSSIILQQYISTRQFSVSLVLEKTKNKGEKKSVGKATKIDLNELSEFLNTDKFIQQLDNAIEDMKKNFVAHLSLRSSVGSIEQIVVNFEGDDFMLQELVQISRKPKIVVLNVTTFPQAIPQVLDAINKSGLNLNPQQDGTTIYIPVPKVTKEHREGLAKNAKALYIKCRDKLKDTKNKELKSVKKAPSISEDQVRRIEAQLEAICEKYVKDAEILLDNKQKELLKTTE